MIFYFSATGNCKYISKKLANKTNDKTISIIDCVRDGAYNYKAEQNEKIGFIIPTYFFGIPMLVQRFLENLKLSNANKKYIYLIMVCGSSTGGAGKVFEKYFNNTIYAKYGIKMIDNYVPMYEIPNQTKIKELLTNADVEIEEIAKSIKSNLSGDYDKYKGVFPNILSKIAYPLYVNRRKTKKFYCTQNCNGCGVCEKSCISNAIEIKNSKPVWVKEKCELCLRCLHICPQKAIQYTKRTEKRGRYINKL